MVATSEKAPRVVSTQGLQFQSERNLQTDNNLTATPVQAKTCSQCGRAAKNLQIFSVLITPAWPVIVLRLCPGCPRPSRLLCEGGAR